MIDRISLNARETLFCEMSFPFKKRFLCHHICSCCVTSGSDVCLIEDLNKLEHELSVSFGPQLS